MGKFKFDVIVGNPPYQEETSETKSRQAKPLYNLFIEQAKKLNPECLSFIIPSRWFAGGMGLDKFREEMMQDKHIASLVDYTNAKDCFPMTSISGGVCYFVRDKNYKGDCQFTNIRNGKRDTLKRPLNEFSVLVRYNAAVEILRKITAKKERSLSEIVGPISPFAIPTNNHGQEKAFEDSVTVYSSKGIGYLPYKEITKGKEYLDAYKVMVSQTSAEHAGEPNKSGKFNVLTQTMRTLKPREVCTHSYLVIGPMENELTCEHLIHYLKTKFVRFLLLQAISSIHLTMKSFAFVPMQDFSQDWTDEKLYEKYGIDEKEAEYIDSLINPME